MTDLEVIMQVEVRLQTPENFVQNLLYVKTTDFPAVSKLTEVE